MPVVGTFPQKAGSQYQAVTYTLQGLDGISQEQLEQHYKLYQGYVTNTNTLNEKVNELITAGKIGTPEYNELKRRFGFEYAGMRLHEFYFSNMKANGGPLPKDSKLARKLADFKGTGMMRGIGWAILYQDSQNGKLQNFWVSDHELGHPPGFQPVLVMDVWEHAYTVDYKPTERKNYVEAFFKNIDWEAVEARLQ
jgi:Fe-Mn family superoxide dismutase